MEKFIVIGIIISPMLGFIAWCGRLFFKDEPQLLDDLGECNCAGIGHALADPDTDDRSVTCGHCGAYADIGCGD